MQAISKTRNKKSLLYGPSVEQVKVSQRIIYRDHVDIDQQLDKKHSWTFMYMLPPVGQITLEDFEVSAIDRLKLLRLIENWKARGKTGKELCDLIREESQRIFGSDSLETCERDWISHHILRLAYSKSQNLRTWFQQQEVSLFETRLQYVGDDVLLQIANNNGLDVEVVSKEKIEELQEELKPLFLREYYDERTKVIPNFSTQNLRVYQVPFASVNSLVRSRRVLLQRGKAYLFGIHLTDYIKQCFKSKLSEAMTQIYKMWPYLEEKENDRLVPFLVNVANKGIEPTQNIYKSLSVYGKNITPDMIDDLAKQSFPLCMKVLYKHLKKDHKLKHMGRMQFGLFLKGIGLTLENALQFWQNEFTQIMTDAEFNKNYAYNIRHSYGKEGKQTNYSPYGCMKIITGMSRPGIDEHHGCPFKNFDEKNLRNEMHGIDDGIVDEIISLVKQNHYQVACRRYFEATHPPMTSDKDMAKDDDGAPFLHPNVYFGKSRRLLESYDKLHAKENVPNGGNK